MTLSATAAMPLPDASKPAFASDWQELTRLTQGRSFFPARETRYATASLKIPAPFALSPL